MLLMFSSNSVAQPMVISLGPSEAVPSLLLRWQPRRSAPNRDGTRDITHLRHGLSSKINARIKAIPNMVVGLSPSWQTESEPDFYILKVMAICTHVHFYSHADDASYCEAIQHRFRKEQETKK